MSGDDPTGEVKFHLFRNLQLEAFAMGGRLNDPECFLLRAGRKDVKRFSPKTQVSEHKKQSKGWKMYHHKRIIFQRNIIK